VNNPIVATLAVVGAAVSGVALALLVRLIAASTLKHKEQATRVCAPYKRVALDEGVIDIPSVLSVEAC
jgi:hypothetical protein